MSESPLRTYRIRIGWLDWFNEIHWTDWYDVIGPRQRRLSTVPVRVQEEAQSGLVLDLETNKPANDLNSVSGRYIPPHRIAAIDWEYAPA
jgi:hypothetical protein